MKEIVNPKANAYNENIERAVDPLVGVTLEGNPLCYIPPQIRLLSAPREVVVADAVGNPWRSLEEALPPARREWNLP